MNPQIPDFQIVVSQTNIVLSKQTIHQWKAYLFSSHMMYKSQFKKIDPYDWFCGPGSHLVEEGDVLTSLLEDLRRVQGICRICRVPRRSETARRCCLAVERNGTR